MLITVRQYDMQHGRIACHKLTWYLVVVQVRFLFCTIVILGTC